MTIAVAVAKPAAAPAPAPSPLRDAWKVATIFYPEVAAEAGALVSFQTHQISIASMERATDEGGWTFAGPFRLRVQRGAGSQSSEAPILEAEIGSDPVARLRSFVLGQCTLYDLSGLYALSKELTEKHAGPAEVEQRLLARFATYPPGRFRDADKAFRERFRAVATILGEISIDDVHFGASSTRDPLDETVELHWLVTGSRGNDRVVALFEPFHGRLVSLEFF